MINMRRGIVLLLVVFYLHVAVAKKLTIEAIVTRFLGECPEYSKAPIKLFDVQYTTDGQLKARYKMKVSRRSSKNLRMTIEIKRCKSREAPDTCTSLGDFQTTQVCKIIESKTQFFTPFIVGCLKPKLGCPMEKGIYIGENCTFDMGSYNMYPLPGYYWKIRPVLFDNETNEIFFCGNGEGYIRRRYT